MRVFYWLLYWLSGFFPRSKKIWVFGSRYGDKFVDNPKWLFLYCNNTPHGIKFIWITKNKVILEQLRSQGLRAYLKNSLGGLWYTLRARIFIFDCYYSNDINFWTSKGSIKLNLWHGIALKRIEKDILIKDNPRYEFFHIKKNFISHLIEGLKPSFSGVDRKYDLMISTSQEVSKIFSSAFGITEEAILLTGFPRNDLLLDDKCRTEMFINEHLPEILPLIKSNKRILLYMPTFRESKNSDDLPFDLEELNSSLERFNAVLLVKLHSDDRRAINLFRNLSNVIFLSNIIDIYPLLPQTFLLITDYSSIYFDYLLLDKPIIFYAYDLENYLVSERGMYYEYENITPGPKAYNFSELLNLLEQYLDKCDLQENQWKPVRKKISEQFHYYKDSFSCARIYGVIRERVQ